MLAVLVCNLCTLALLAGLLGGIVAGFVGARVRIARALAYDPPVDLTLWQGAGRAAPV